MVPGVLLGLGRPARLVGRQALPVPGSQLLPVALVGRPPPEALEGRPRLSALRVLAPPPVLVVPLLPGDLPVLRVLPVRVAPAFLQVPVGRAAARYTRRAKESSRASRYQTVSAWECLPFRVRPPNFDMDPV